MTQEQRIRELLQRYIDNTAGPEEIQELDALFADPKQESLLKEILQETYTEVKEQYADQHVGLAAKERIFDHVVAQEQYREIPGTPRRRWLWPATAAAVIIALGTGIFFYQQRSKLEQKQEQLANDIKPGGNKAYLTLGNGKRISLSDAANGDVAQQAGLTITKTADGELVYEIKSGNGAETDEPTYNTIETPNGGQYQVRLPDGTAVWLNAASSLKYPASFAANKERRVQLRGEAYFQVAKDKARPFVVSAKEQEVTVLGTHFNINAYDDENNIKTTLLEGSVKVGNSGRAAMVLKPGEQAVNDSGDLSVSPVNTDYAVAWKNGYFRFNEKSLEEGLREIARWYNVDVVYEKEALKREPLAGRVSKYEHINQVLKKMEMAGFFHFSIQGRKIIVK